MEAHLDYALEAIACQERRVHLMSALGVEADHFVVLAVVAREGVARDVGKVVSVDGTVRVCIPEADMRSGEAAFVKDLEAKVVVGRLSFLVEGSRTLAARDMRP